MKLWQRTSFWQKVIISFNIILTSLQAVLLANNAEHIWNYLSLGGQVLGNLGGLWTEDKNKNDVPDIIEQDFDVVSTTTTTVKKGEPVKSDTETKIETKPKDDAG